MDGLYKLIEEGKDKEYSLTETESRRDQINQYRSKYPQFKKLFDTLEEVNEYIINEKIQKQRV